MLADYHQMLARYDPEQAMQATSKVTLDIKADNY